MACRSCSSASIVSNASRYRMWLRCSLIACSESRTSSRRSPACAVPCSTGARWRVPKNRLKAFAPELGHYACAPVYAPRYRSEWPDKLVEPGVRARVERMHQQLDEWQSMHRQVRRALLIESRKHAAVKLLVGFLRLVRFRRLCWWPRCIVPSPLPQQAAPMGVQRLRR